MIPKSTVTGRILLAAAVCALAWGGAVQANDAKKAPEFTWPDVNPASPSYGKEITLSEIYADEGVVLNFIASWCPPCWKELPSFLKFAGESSTPVLLIAADEHGPSSDLLRLAKELEVGLPILLVPKEKIGWMEERYDHSMLPTTYMIDFQGRVRQVMQGMVSEESLYRAAAHHYPKSGIEAPPASAARGVTRQ